MIESFSDLEKLVTSLKKAVESDLMSREQARAVWKNEIRLSEIITLPPFNKERSPDVIS